MFNRLTTLALLVMSFMLVLTVSTVSAHAIATDLTNPPALSKTTDDTVDGGRYPNWKHVVWEHAHRDLDWEERGKRQLGDQWEEGKDQWGIKWLPQSVEVEVGDMLNWSDLNQLEHTAGCITTHSRSYSRTAIYGASNGLVAENAYERDTNNGNNHVALSGDWGLSGEFTHVGTIYVYRVTMGFHNE